MEIREKRLYQQAGWDTFEGYCEERWGWKRAHAYRLMDAAEVIKALSPTGDTIPFPATERQARELAPLRHEPEALREVWQEVQQQHGENITAANVRATRGDGAGV